MASRPTWVVRNALGEDETEDLGVVVDHTVEIGSLEGRVSDASWLDHDFALAAWRFQLAFPGGRFRLGVSWVAGINH
jgi:hypothetical protein